MKHLPREFRRLFHVVRRAAVDRMNSTRRRMTPPVRANSACPLLGTVILTLRQPILKTSSVAAKRHNIKNALNHVNGLVLKPGAIFSFWHLVGRPTKRNGFQPGRSLLGGQLAMDTGGGLCQLSGLIYHASLMAGLQVVERHPHSVDIYTDETRYAPLGSDATVAYGFKDLRIENTIAAPVQFRFNLSEESITVEIRSDKDIPLYTIEFIPLENNPQHALVETLRRPPSGGTPELIHVCRYSKPIEH